MIKCMFFVRVLTGILLTDALRIKPKRLLKATIAKG